MAPDKIYINKQSEGFGYYHTQLNPPYEEEYIRKDYLLEWAKKEMKEWLSDLIQHKV